MNINKRKTINVVVILILTGIMLFLGKERRGESVVETKDLHSAYRDIGKENGESLFQIIGQEMLKKTNQLIFLGLEQGWDKLIREIRKEKNIIKNGKNLQHILCYCIPRSMIYHNKRSW